MTLPEMLVGLYLNPQDNAVVLCVGTKSNVKCHKRIVERSYNRCISTLAMAGIPLSCKGSPTTTYGHGD